MDPIAHLRRRAALWGVLLAALVLGLGPGTAFAIGFDLDVEFDTGQIGSFADVTIAKDGDALDFRIELGDALGAGADLHEFYFNLAGFFTGVAISTDDLFMEPYSLSPNPSVAGGAGATFEFGVNFGNGGGPQGNGVLTEATFTLTADQPLSIDDLREFSSASGDSIEIHVAAHVQGTELISGYDSETVGGVVPEPATNALVALGLALLGTAARLGRNRSDGGAPFPH